jgi:hypothetical protein
VPLDDKTAFDLAKKFLKSVLYTKNPWPASQEHELDICEKACNDALDTMTVQQRVVNALNGIQRVWEHSGGPSEQIDALTCGIVSLRSILQV